MEIVNTTSTTDPVNMYDYLNSFIMNPMVFVILLLIIVVYYVFSSSLGNNQSFSVSSYNTSSTSTYGTGIIGTIIIVIVICLILVNAFQYFFSINLTGYIQGLFSPETEIDLVVENTTKTDGSSSSSDGSSFGGGSDGSSFGGGSGGGSGGISGGGGSGGGSTDSNDGNITNFFSKLKTKKQVFNIPGNNYDYENAQAICKAYDSELASYNQLEDAYNNGAEWCNYGWSSNQMALFPTQKQSYNHLQTIKGHENDCGRPGINGGYMANPKVRFGVNCYGYKPKIRKEEEELMKTASPYPESMKDKEFQNRVDLWKNKINEILVSPFNYDIWATR